MDKAAASAVVTYSFAGDVISSVATRVFDANGVPGALSTATANSTETLETDGTTLGGTTNAASAITTPLSEEDFAHVAAE